MNVRRFLAAAIVASAAATPAGTQSIRGTVVDSVSRKPVPNAKVAVYNTALETVADSLGRFMFSDVPAGDRALTIHTASLDSVNASYTVPVLVSGATTTVSLRVPTAFQIAAMACGDRGYERGGIVLGRLRVADDSTARLSGTVSAEWPTTGGSARKSVSATSDAHGRFALCGVPLDIALNLQAVTDGARGQSAGLRVSPAARFARAELVLSPQAATVAGLAGFVTDSLNRPIGGAEVSLPELTKTTLTNAEGAFAIDDIPPGDQLVRIRRLGYGPVETKLTFAAGRTLQRRIALSRATALDSVTVTEKRYDPVLGDFDDNRRLGLGHFTTREELAKLEGVSTASVLRSIPGISVVGREPYGFVSSARAQAMMTSSVPVAEIEAIEYYASVSQLPAKYLTQGSVCGVLVIHTLRYHRDTTAAPGKPPA